MHTITGDYTILGLDSLSPSSRTYFERSLRAFLSTLRSGKNGG